MKILELDEDHDLFVFNAGNNNHAKSIVARFTKWTKRYSEDRCLYGTYSAQQQRKYVCIIKATDPCTGFYRTIPPVDDSDTQPINTFDEILKHLAIAELIAAVMQSPLDTKTKTKLIETLKGDEK